MDNKSWLIIHFPFFVFNFSLIFRGVFDQNQIAVEDGANDVKFFAVVRPLKIRNISGSKIPFHRINLVTGIYLFTLTDNSKHFRTGRFIVTD